MKVVFSDRAYAAVMAETTEKIQTETGGLFLGTVDNDTWYIIEAIDPGPKSIFEVAYFEYDQKYTQHLINKIANLYDEKLQLIGLWHRHPGSFDIFSTTDNGTNAKYAQMRNCGAISALVNIDPKFRITMYHVGQPCKYSKIAYVVGNELIPDKYLRLKTPQRYEKIMDEILNGKNANSDLHPSVSFKSFLSMIKPFFTDRYITDKIVRPKELSEDAKNALIEAVVSDIDFMSDELGIELQIVQKNGLLALIQDTVDGVVKLFFVYDENKQRTVFQYEGLNYVYEDGLFENLYKMSEDSGPLDAQSELEGQSIIDIQEVVEQDARRILDGVRKIIRFDRRGE